MGVPVYIKNKFKGVVDRVLINKKDRELCSLLAEKSGLGFKASVEKCNYMGDPTNDVLFSYRAPSHKLAEDLSTNLIEQTGLRFESGKGLIYVAVKNAWVDSYCFGASYDEFLEKFKEINQDELKDIVRAKTEEVKEAQNLQIA